MCRHSAYLEDLKQLEKQDARKFVSRTISDIQDHNVIFLFIFFLFNIVIEYILCFFCATINICICYLNRFFGSSGLGGEKWEEGGWGED